MIVETCPKCGAVLMDTIICTIHLSLAKIVHPVDGTGRKNPKPIEYRPFGGNGLEALKDGSSLLLRSMQEAD